MSQIRTNRVSNDSHLRFKPRQARVITMTLQPQERPQTQADMIAPRSGRAYLRAFDQTVLFHSAMVVFDRPGKVRPLHPLQAVHDRVVRGPVFNVPVCGDDLEYANQAIPFQPHDPSWVAYLYGTNGGQTLAVGIDVTIGFQARQPEPLKRAHHFEIVQSRIPTVKHHTGGLKTARVRHFEQVLKVIILRQPILRLVKNPVVTGDVPVSFSPQQGQQEIGRASCRERV